ncbi:MAG TPA: VWA domain-containing protein [Acidobacteriaceae bacterium]|nr:VWA domain-containing protein [Acidobacteriaceae bacterium]
MRCAPLAILAVAFLFGTCARAQTQKSSAAPTLKVYTRETVVDVSVTDAKGNPVHGLTRDDFTVKEDGKPQPIRSFEEFGASATPQPTRKLPPNVYTNLQPPPAGPALNIILLDGLNMAPPDASAPQQVSQSFTVQARVKEGAEKYLRAMPPGTRVAVLNLTDHLRILQGFTSDPALLRASVDAMQLDMEGHASTVTKGMPPLQIEQLIEQWRTLQNSRNRATLEALNQIAVDFAGVKGKKNLFWFSAGFPTLVLQGDNEQAGLPDYNVDLHRTYALLEAAQIVIYPLGGRTPGMPIVSPTGPFGIITPSSMAYGPVVADEQLSLEQMAEATGGRAFYNSNDLAVLLGKAIAAGSDYYTLSYAPPGTKFDGRHHTIHVELDKPGLHLIYRTEYWAEDPNAIKPSAELSLVKTISPATSSDPEDPEATMQLAMGRAMPSSTDLLFDVEVKPVNPADLPAESAKPVSNGNAPVIFGHLDPKLNGKPLTRYGVTYAIPGKQIAFTTAANNIRHGALEFDIAAYDGDAKLLTSLSQSINLPLTAEQAAQLAHSPFRFFQQLDLPGGALFLRIGVLDRISGKIGTLEIPLVVPKK